MQSIQLSSVRRRASRRSGFTLIEILIVVIILGILAAIVIPQFSNASTQARKSAVNTTAQTMRTQIAHYKLDHNDVLPTATDLWTAMTTQTDVAGAAYVAGTSTSGPFGPYLPSTPVNPLNSDSTVLDAAVAPGSKTASACGFEYDYTNGTGNFYGTDTDGETVVN